MEIDERKVEAKARMVLGEEMRKNLAKGRVKEVVLYTRMARWRGRRWTWRRSRVARWVIFDWVDRLFVWMLVC